MVIINFQQNLYYFLRTKDSFKEATLKLQFRSLAQKFRIFFNSVVTFFT